MSNLWYQTDLRNGDTHQTCWLDMKLRAGQIVSLKDDDRKWLVVMQHDTAEKHIPRRRWNVGGIESEII